MIYPISIPSNAGWFYVSDSFTLTINAPNTSVAPGPANSDFVMGPNQAFKVYIKSCSLELIPFVAANWTQGVNTDVQIGIYRVDGGVTFKGPVGFGSPYGGAPNGMILNSVCSLAGNSPRSARDFGIAAPLILSGVTPNDAPTAQYLLGAHLVFNCGMNGILAAYQYHIHGAITLV